METTSCYAIRETNILDLTDGLLCVYVGRGLRRVSVVEYWYVKLKSALLLLGQKLSKIISLSEF